MYKYVFEVTPSMLVDFVNQANKDDVMGGNVIMNIDRVTDSLTGAYYLVIIERSTEASWVLDELGKLSMKGPK